MSEPTPLHPISRIHLDRLSDATGIREHAVGSEPDPTHGYCTDDVARALEVDLLHARTLGWPAVAGSAWRNLRFLADAFDDLTGRFRNVRRSDGSWAPGRASDDSQGRAMLGLSAAIATAPDARLVAAATALFADALPQAQRVAPIRAQASVILACDAVHRASPTGQTAAAHRLLATDLLRTFDVASRGPELAVAGGPGDVRERPTGTRPDRRRTVARLDRDGRPRTGRPRLAGRRPDGRRRPSLADRQRLVDPGRGEGHVRPATHRGHLAAARGRDGPGRDRRPALRRGHGSSVCLVPRGQRPRRRRRGSGSGRKLRRPDPDRRQHQPGRRVHADVADRPRAHPGPSRTGGRGARGSPPHPTAPVETDRPLVASSR